MMDCEFAAREMSFGARGVARTIRILISFLEKRRLNSFVNVSPMVKTRVRLRVYHAVKNDARVRQAGEFDVRGETLRPRAADSIHSQPLKSRTVGIPRKSRSNPRTEGSIPPIEPARDRTVHRPEKSSHLSASRASAPGTRSAKRASRRSSVPNARATTFFPTREKKRPLLSVSRSALTPRATPRRQTSRPSPEESPTPRFPPLRTLPPREREARDARPRDILPSRRPIRG